MQLRTSKIQKKVWSFEDYITSLSNQLEQGLIERQRQRQEELENIYRQDPVAYVKSLSFRPFDWQSQVLGSGKTRIILNCSRQSGKSTIVSVMPCHTAKYVPGSLSLIIAATEFQAREDKGKVLSFMAMDPTYPEIVRNSDKGLELSNGSRIVIVPGTDKSARGYSCPNLVILDEASRIEDLIYTSGVRPMFTDNPTGRLVILSTPNGQTGFFHSIFTRDDDVWLRILVRSPWEPVMTGAGLSLAAYKPKEAFIDEQLQRKVFADYSPRHNNYDEQSENLTDMGRLLYLQEYCCEFVETEDSVFTYETINKMFGTPAKPIEAVTKDAPADTNDFGRFFK